MDFQTLNNHYSWVKKCEETQTRFGIGGHSRTDKAVVKGEVYDALLSQNFIDESMFMLPFHIHMYLINS